MVESEGLPDLIIWTMINFLPEWEGVYSYDRLKIHRKIVDQIEGGALKAGRLFNQGQKKLSSRVRRQPKKVL